MALFAVAAACLFVQVTFARRSRDPSMGQHLKVVGSKRASLKFNASLGDLGLIELDPAFQPDAGAPFHFWNRGVYEPGQLPRLGIAPKTVEDIQNVLKFAKQNALTVNTKVHGHSYAGTSAAGADVLVSMSAHFSKVQIDDGSFKDSCGTSHNGTAIVGGGTSWIEFYKALGPKYTSVGGACDSVSAAGGWLLNNGLGLTSQRFLGLGVDNVVEWNVVLADGTVAQVDKCSRPELFRTLRGGGPGFAVTTSVRYKLAPPTPVHEFQIGFKKSLCKVYNNSDNFWDLVVKHSFPGNRWALWPAQHQDTDEFGAGDEFKIWLYFLGSADEAKNQPVYKDFLAWAQKCPPHAVIDITSPHATFQDYKIHGSIESARMSGIRNYKSPGKNGNFPYFGNRLIPARFIKDKPVEARKMFQLIEGKTCDNFYHMGGKISENIGMEDSVSKHVRESAWQVGLCDAEALEALRKMFPAGSAGIGQNHQGWHEPQWKETIWGDEKYGRLLKAKKKVDPDNLFKCRHCVGVGEDD